MLDPFLMSFLVVFTFSFPFLEQGMLCWPRSASQVVSWTGFPTLLRLPSLYPVKWLKFWLWDGSRVCWECRRPPQQ